MTDDQTFLEAFEACTLEQFRHHDHVRLAWILLRRGPLEDALPHLTAGIRRFAASKGAHGLYHQTITWTYLFVIHERMTAMPADHDWPAFREANPDLFENHREFLARYYSAEALDSDRARRGYVLPDRGYRLAA